MKDKRVVYCEYSFWEEFFKLERERSVLYNRTRRRLWDDFYDFLDNSKLYFNIGKKEIDINSIGGTALFDFLQRRGGANIKFIPDEFPIVEQIEDEDDDLLNALFLKSADMQSCIEISERTGVFVFNIDMIFSAEHVYKNNGESFTKTNGLNWNYMLDLKDKCPSISYCNSLIIADRYILANTNDKTLEYNLKPILNALLPDHLGNEICFNICILAENIGKGIDNKYEKIKSLIKNIRPNLKFSFNIFNTKRLHDRSILTNNIFLTSGAGFDVIGENQQPIKFTTTALIFPFLQNDVKDNIYYIDWIDNILREEDKCDKYNENYWGDEETHHHLLDYYYEKPQLSHSSFTMSDVIDQKLLTLLRS